MGPLSIKAKVQADAGAAKNQMLVIKTISDEARKKKLAEAALAHKQELHELKMAKEVAKAKADGVSIDIPKPDRDDNGYSDGRLTIPKPGTKNPDTTLKAPMGGHSQPGTGINIPRPGHAGPSTELTNPEAGPSDTVPAMLTPGEAVIPASVAQDSAFRPVIAALVEEGRNRNRQPGGVKEGYADGTDSLPPMGVPPKPKSLWEKMTEKKVPVPAPAASASGSLIEAGKAQRSGRQAQLDAAEKKAMGLADGGVLDDNAVMMAESGGNPTARNPNSTATGLYQMLDSARRDAEAANPDLKGRDFKDPAVQEEYRTTYKGVLADRLKGRGIEPTPDNINRAWVVGDKGLYDLSQNPDKTISEILGRRVTDINPNLQGKTAAEFLADPDPYSVKGRGESTVIPTVIPSVGGGRGVVNPPMVDPNAPPPKKLGGIPGALEGWATRVLGREGQVVPQKQPAAGSIPEAVDAWAGRILGRNPQVTTPTTPREQAPIPPVSPVSPPAPDGFTIPKKSEVVPAPTGPTQADARRFDVMLADPVVKEQLEEVQKKEPPAGVDYKDWLAKQLEKVFGDKGMFNGQDLVRFSVLAAGGLLTGGSTAGSLRFAAVNTMNQADARNVAVAQAEKQAKLQLDSQKFQMVKDTVDRHQKLEDVYNTQLEKATPEARALAGKIWAEARGKDIAPAVTEAKLQQAIQILASNQVDYDKQGKNKDPVFGMDSVTGKEIVYKWDKDTLMVQGKDGNFVPASSVGAKPMPTSDFNQRENSKRDLMVKGLKARLVSQNQGSSGPIDKNYTDSAAETHAQGLAAELMNLRQDFGFNADEKSWERVMDHTVATISDSYRGKNLSKLSREQMAKLVYGSAVIALNPTNKALYQVERDDKKNARPGEEAVVNYGAAIKKAEEQGYAKDDIIKGWEAKFKALDPKVLDKFKIKAATTPGGYSPYLLWVHENMKDK